MHKIHLNSPQKYTRNTRNTRQLFIKINICLPTLTAWESDKQGAALNECHSCESSGIMPAVLAFTGFKILGKWGGHLCHNI